jgi:glutamine synthetase
MEQIKQAKQIFSEHNIEFFLMSFVDIHGTPRAKLVPAECFEDVVGGAAGFAGFAVDGLGQGPHDPDLSCVPVTDSTIYPLPWKPGLAWVAGNLQLDGSEWGYCPRTILSRNLAAAQSAGFKFMLGIEPEFFLVEKTAEGGVKVADHGDTLTKPCYSQLSLLRNADFLTTVIKYLNQLGYGVYQNDHEDANGQFEINWKYADAMKTADQVSFFKFMIKALAEEKGLHATFMPKPFRELTGNGSHMHMSLWDAEGKENLFLDKSDPRGLSSIALAFLGGVIHHAKALCAVTAPTVNSYKRLGAPTVRSGAAWAPVFVTHGRNNRTMMVRVPAPGRLEYRTADGASNPYLAASCLLAAGMDGIAKGMNPGDEKDGNLFLLSMKTATEQGIGLLPANLGDAVDALERDEVLCEALGGDYAKDYIEAKRAEWDDYFEMAGKSITSWELQRYLSL